MRQMMRAVLLVTLASSTLAGAGRPDPPALLAAARHAMGGDALLGSISTLSFAGSVVQTVKGGNVISVGGKSVMSVAGARTNMSLDIKMALPDKWLRVTKYAPAGSTTLQEVTEYRGFNGDDPIRDTSAPSGGPLEGTNAPNPNSPAARAGHVADAKHAFAELLLPLFAASFAGYPLEFTSGGTQEQTPSGPADVVNAKGPDGLQLRLYLDASTHLPVLVTGTAKPMISALFVESMMEEQEWRMVIADYRVSNGVNWPRKLTSSFGDSTTEEVRLDRFTINPKIDPKVFKPSNGR